MLTYATWLKGRRLTIKIMSRYLKKIFLFPYLKYHQHNPDANEDVAVFVDKVFNRRVASLKQTTKQLVTETWNKQKNLFVCLSVCLSDCLSLSLSWRKHETNSKLTLSLSLLSLSHLHVVIVGVPGVGGTVCVVWVLNVREFPWDCLTTAEGSLKIKLLSVEGFIPICGIVKVHVIINPTTFEL